jgi:hypothetical protein
VLANPSWRATIAPDAFAGPAALQGFQCYEIASGIQTKTSAAIADEGHVVAASRHTDGLVLQRREDQFTAAAIRSPTAKAPSGGMAAKSLISN